jgi:hypothetical protein
METDLVNPELLLLILFAAGVVAGGLSLFATISGPLALTLAFVPVLGVAFSMVFC